MNTQANRTLVFAALLASSTALNAIPITINTVDSDWTNVVGGGTSLNFVDTDGMAGNEEIRWGSARVQSGYRFDSGAPPAFAVETGEQFTLGYFTHFNNPIFGSSIASAQLEISTSLTINGTMVFEGPFAFSFSHNETPNSCRPQPSCANDIVSFANLSTSDTFEVDGQQLTLELLGFEQGGVFTDTFSTVEGQTNVAQLHAIFRMPSQAIPEPASVTLFSLGVLGMSAGILRQHV